MHLKVYPDKLDGPIYTSLKSFAAQGFLVKKLLFFFSHFFSKNSCMDVSMLMSVRLTLYNIIIYL
jgi:hypothetical protein